MLGFITGLIIARGLEPSEYGVFAFLLASFSALLQLLDMGTSNAFFTFASKRIRSVGFIASFIGWLLIQFFLSIMFIWLLAPDEWLQTIWHGESRVRIAIAFCAVFMQRQVWNFVTQLGESQRLTIKIQLLNIIIAVVHLTFIVCFFIFGKLSVELVFGLVFIEFICATVLALFFLPIETTNEKLVFRDMLCEYKEYCLPLIPYAWFGVVMSFADTWLLQQYGGAEQQAFYSVGAQFAMVSLLATMSVLKILWKEVAEAWAEQQLERVRLLYQKSARILFFLGGIVSGFLVPWTETIISLTVGPQYIDGKLAMMIMFLYPIHQSLGQVAGSMFLAMEKTKEYVVLGTIHITVSLIAVYFVLAGPDGIIPGMGLGAVGLSLKMVVIQIITVNLTIYYLCKVMKWQYVWFYQLLEIALLLMLGSCCYYLTNLLLPEGIHPLILLLFGGAVYSFSIVFVVLIKPSRLGLENVSLISKFRQKLNLS